MEIFQVRQIWKIHHNKIEITILKFMLTTKLWEPVKSSQQQNLHSEYIFTHVS